MSETDSSSGFAGSVENGTFLELFPTSLSTSVDPSSGHLSNVYVYVSIFLSLLAFLLLLLIIALQRLKNIISSSSSYPEYPSDAGSSFYQFRSLQYFLSEVHILKPFTLKKQKNTSSDPALVLLRERNDPFG